MIKSKATSQPQPSFVILDDAALNQVAGGVAEAYPRPVPISGPHRILPLLVVDPLPRFEPPAKGTGLL